MIPEKRNINNKKKLTIQYINKITALMTKYNAHITTGEQNAILTINAIGHVTPFLIQDLAIKASDEIISIMENMINNNVKVSEALDEQVIDFLAKFNINPISTEDDNADFENGSFLISRE